MILDQSENNKRIAKNTLLLYFRMFFTMAVTLYTSRVILKALGVEDFGIYNVVAGIVTLFSFLLVVHLVLLHLVSLVLNWEVITLAI